VSGCCRRHRCGIGGSESGLSSGILADGACFVRWLSLWHRRAMAWWAPLRSDHPSLKSLCSSGPSIAQIRRLTSGTLGGIDSVRRTGSQSPFYRLPTPSRPSNALRRGRREPAARASRDGTSSPISSPRARPSRPHPWLARRFPRSSSVYQRCAPTYRVCSRPERMPSRKSVLVVLRCCA
jgi:hypothetical protein